MGHSIELDTRGSHLAIGLKPKLASKVLLVSFEGLASVDTNDNRFIWTDSHL
jgi:hypothetical protein